MALNQLSELPNVSDGSFLLETEVCDYCCMYHWF